MASEDQSPSDPQTAPFQWGAILSAVKDQIPSMDSDVSVSDCDDNGELFIFQRDEANLIPDFSEELELPSSDEADLQKSYMFMRHPRELWNEDLESSVSPTAESVPRSVCTEEMLLGRHDFGLLTDEKASLPASTLSVFLTNGHQYGEGISGVIGGEDLCIGEGQAILRPSADEASPVLNTSEKERRKVIETQILSKVTLGPSSKDVVHPPSEKSSDNLNRMVKAESKPGIISAEHPPELSLFAFKDIEKWDLDKLLQGLEKQSDDGSWTEEIAFPSTDHETSRALSQARLMGKLEELCLKQSRAFFSHRRRRLAQLPHFNECHGDGRDVPILAPLTNGRCPAPVELQCTPEPPTIYIDLRDKASQKCALPADEKQSSSDSSTDEEEDTKVTSREHVKEGLREPFRPSRKDCTGKSFLLQQLRNFRRQMSQALTTTQDKERNQSLKKPEEKAQPKVRRRRCLKWRGLASMGPASLESKIKDFLLLDRVDSTARPSGELQEESEREPSSGSHPKSFEGKNAECPRARESQKEKQVEEKLKKEKLQEQLERFKPQCSVTGKQPMAEQTPVLFHSEASFLVPIKTLPTPKDPEREMLLLTIGLSSCTQVTPSSQQQRPFPETSLPAANIYAAVVAWLLSLAAERAFAMPAGFYWQTVETDEEYFTGSSDIGESSGIDTEVAMTLLFETLLRNPMAVHHMLQLFVASGLDVCGLRLLYPRYSMLLSSMDNEPSVLALSLRGVKARSVLQDIIGPSDPQLAILTDCCSMNAIYCTSRTEPLAYLPHTDHRVLRELRCYFGGVTRCAFSCLRGCDRCLHLEGFCPTGGEAAEAATQASSLALHVSEPGLMNGLAEKGFLEEVQAYLHSCVEPEPSLCFHVVPYTNSVLQALGGSLSSVPDPCKVPLDVFCHRSYASHSEMEQIVLLTLSGREAMKSAGRFLHQILALGSQKQAQAPVSEEFDPRFELLALKWLPHLTRIQAKEVTPFEVGDKSWQASIATLMSGPALVCALRRINAFAGLAEILRTCAPRDSKPSAHSCHLQAVMSLTPEMAFRQAVLFFTKKDFVDDPKCRPGLKYLPPPGRPSQTRAGEIRRSHAESLFHYMQRGAPVLCTVLLIKPGIWARNLARFLRKLDQEKFRLVGLKHIDLNPEDVGALLSPEAQQDPAVFEAHSSYLTSGSSLVLCLQRENAVKKLLDLLGPEDPKQARAVSQFLWRAQYGLSTAQNGFYERPHLAVLCQTTCLIFPGILLQGAGRPPYLELLEQLISKDFLVTGARLTTMSKSQSYVISGILSATDGKASITCSQLTDGPCLVLAAQRDNAVICFGSLLTRWNDCGGQKATARLRPLRVKYKTVANDIRPFHKAKSQHDRSEAEMLLQCGDVSNKLTRSRDQGRSPSSPEPGPVMRLTRSNLHQRLSRRKSRCCGCGWGFLCGKGTQMPPHRHGGRRIGPSSPPLNRTVAIFLLACSVTTTQDADCQDGRIDKREQTGVKGGGRGRAKEGRTIWGPRKGALA
ncbi:dynein axonemal assembly factor 8 [Tiliqua scincoides]|uniref:dynein axonemal assembly factor 8 n=1 Tax=Tiliqua scincoides TaxID=71010 RepID=UPI003463765B